jgi:hypothetical protein
MTLTIHKFPLDRHDTTHIRAGRRFDPIQVGMQHDTVTVWAEVEKEDNLKYQYDFDVYGTGWDIPSDAGTYVGSAFDRDYVWHVYFKRV